jgi:phosphatidylglycerophosphate synthase
MIKDPIYGRNNLFAAADEAVNTFIFRPLGWPIAKFLKNTPITANQLTFIGLIFGILSGVFYFYGGNLNYFFGALFLFIASLIDCTDGPLARLKNMQSEFGKILEGIVDYLVGLSVFIGLSISLYRESNYSKGTLFVIVILFFLIIIQNIGWDYSKMQFMNIMEKGIFEPVTSFKDFCQKHAEMRYKERGVIAKISIRGYYIYNLAVERFLSPTFPYEKREVKYFNEDERKQYYKRFRLIMRLWTWNAAKTKIVFIVLCTIFYQKMILIFGLLLGFNLLWIMTFIAHKTNFYKKS